MSQQEKVLDVKEIINSNIFRVLIFLLLLVFYYIFLSPTVEEFFIKNIADIVRAKQIEQINVLSPVYDIYANTTQYNLSTYSKNLKAPTISNTRFFTIDPRVVALNKFLKDYHSPMASSAETFVKEADKHGLDWRLLAAISGVESAFGNITPGGTNNAWGWRGVNRNEGGWSIFATWDAAIIHITERFASGYGTTMTPFEIEPIYCPPCGENPEHAWANGVVRYMGQIQYYLDNLDKI